MKRWTWYEDGMYPVIDRRVEKVDLCDDEEMLYVKYSEVEAELAKEREISRKYNEMLGEATVRELNLTAELAKKDEEIARLQKEIEELKDALSGIREREE